MADLQYKRIYEAKEPADGYRILVDRLWPRGLKKENAGLDNWAKEITPSDQLRRALHEADLTPQAFEDQYEQELDKNEEWPAFRDDVKAQLEAGRVTLLSAARGEMPPHVAVLLRRLSPR